MGVKLLSCPKCGDAPEMHSSEGREIEAWNKAVEDYKKNEDNTCSDCIHKDDDGGYCLDCYNGMKKS